MNVEKREPLHTVGGILNCRAIMENNMEDLQKTKNRTTIYFSNFSSRNISKGHKILIQKSIYTFVFIPALFTRAKT